MAEAPPLYAFEAPTIQEALAQVRRELGAKATIVETARRKERRWLGFTRPESVRVVANPAPAAPEWSERIGELQRQIDSMNALLAARRAASTAAPARLERLAAAARAAGLSPASLDEMLADIDGGAAAAAGAGSTASLASLLKLWLTPQLPPCELELGARVRSLAVVGPTGAGKTTLISRLASAWQKRGRGTLSVMTLDTHRMGGMEPLRTLAGLWKVSFDPVYGPEDFARARRSRASRDLILIDTPGLSPFGRGAAEAAAESLARVPADAVVLALPASTRWRETERLAARYAPLKPRALAATKLDESDNPALLLDLCRGLSLPLAYLCDTQKLNEDIRRAECEPLTDAIVSQLLSVAPGAAA